MSDGTIRVTQTQLEELFKIVKFQDGKWKKKSEAARRMKLSRPTIDKILRQYPQGMPEKPKKTIPKYFEEFEQTRCYSEIRNRYYDIGLRKIKRTGQLILGILREAWKARNKKDPLDFDLNDFLFFWGTSTQAPYPQFTDPQTNKIAFNKAVALRQAMMIGRARDLVKDPRFTTRGLKREAGRRKYWYLEPEDIIAVVNVIQEPDTLLFFYLGILMGGRGNALRNIKVDDIHRDAQTVLVRETKIGKTVEKDLFAFVMELIWQYVIDYDIKTALFYWNLDAYNDRLIQASKDAGLPESKRITSHMLKHTCVTQMSLHGVDIDVISDYVETDPATLMAFYRGGGREKVRAQILNLPRTEEKWIEFVRKLHPYFVERYNYIKPFAAKVDGIKARVPPK